VEAKLLHCFEQWRTPSGLEVKCGGGLTQKHIDEAVAFLRDGQDAARYQSVESAESAESEEPFSFWQAPLFTAGGRSEDKPERPLNNPLANLDDASAVMKDASETCLSIALSDLDATCLPAKPRRDPADFCSAATTAPDTTRSFTPVSILEESSVSDIHSRTHSTQHEDFQVRTPSRQPSRQFEDMQVRTPSRQQSVHSAPSWETPVRRHVKVSSVFSSVKEMPTTRSAPKQRLAEEAAMGAAEKSGDEASTMSDSDVEYRAWPDCSAASCQEQHNLDLDILDIHKCECRQRQESEEDVDELRSRCCSTDDDFP